MNAQPGRSFSQADILDKLTSDDALAVLRILAQDGGLRSDTTAEMRTFIQEHLPLWSAALLHSLSTLADGDQAP